MHPRRRHSPPPVVAPKRRKPWRSTAREHLEQNFESPEIQAKMPDMHISNVCPCVCAYAGVHVSVHVQVCMRVSPMHTKELSPRIRGGCRNQRSKNKWFNTGCWSCFCAPAELTCGHPNALVLLYVTSTGKFHTSRRSGPVWHYHF